MSSYLNVGDMVYVLYHPQITSFVVQIYRVLPNDKFDVCDKQTGDCWTVDKDQIVKVMNLKEFSKRKEEDKIINGKDIVDFINSLKGRFFNIVTKDSKKILCKFDSSKFAAGSEWITVNSYTSKDQKYLTIKFSDIDKISIRGKELIVR